MIRILLLFLLTTTIAFAENQFDCGEDLNGHTPADCVDTTTIPDLAGSPSCSGSSGDNSANSQSTHYIFRDSVPTESLLENTSYDHYWVCDTVAVTGDVANINRDCSSEPAGYCSIAGYWDSYDKTQHPYWLADADRSYMERIEFDTGADSWRVRGMTLTGPGEGSGSSYVLMARSGASNIVANQNYFKTDGMIIAGVFAFHCRDSSTGNYFGYNYMEGTDLQRSAYDNADTQGITLAPACNDQHVHHNEIKDYTDGIQVNAGISTHTGSDITIKYNHFYLDQNIASCAAGENEPASEDDTCGCHENHIDIKRMGASGAGNHGVIAYNILEKSYPQAESVGSATTECGGTGGANGSVIELHYNASNVEVHNNIFMDYSNGISSGNDGFDTQFPDFSDVANNIFYQQRKRNQAKSVASFGINMNQMEDARILGNSFVDPNSNIDDCLQMDFNQDVEGNFFDSDCNVSGSNTGNNEDNMYNTGAEQISGETDAHTGSVTLGQFCFFKHPITGATQSDGSTQCTGCLDHRGDLQCINAMPPTGWFGENDYTKVPNSAKGPQ